MIQPEDYTKRNVWFWEMGPRESKIKSPPKTTTRSNGGNGASAMTGRRGLPMRTMQPSGPEPVPVWPERSVRWERRYDVYICHSREDADCSYAMEMLSDLEQQPEKLRCFLPMRDMSVGSPVSSEMCSGLESSHCWVMLLTPHFLADDWCKYQMHQSLAQAPCSDGRLIPVLIGLSFAQYPPEMKHMYAFMGALNDSSVFTKVKGAILTYLKRMITVTSDQIPAYSPSNRTPESRESSGTPVETSQEEHPVTKESISDMSSKSPEIKETISDISSKSPEIKENTSDLSSECPVTQETTSDMSLKNPVTQETTNDLSLKNPVTQETTSEMLSRTPLTEEIPTGVSSRSLLSQESVSSKSSGCPVTNETTREVSLRSLGSEETLNYVSKGSSLTGLGTTSEMPIRSSVIGQMTTINMSSRTSMTEETTSDLSLGSPVTQETPSEVSLRSLVLDKTTSELRSSMAAQENTNNVSMIRSVIGLKTTSDVSSRTPMTEETNRSLVTQQTTSNMSMRNSMIRQETTSDLSMRSSIIRQETTSDVSIRRLIQETPINMIMRSSVTRPETTSDTSSGSPLTTSDMSITSSRQETSNDLNLSPPLINNIDICTDCIAPAPKDSFSRESRIDTTDSGVWSMTMDLHTDCMSDEETASMHSHSHSRMDELT